jgi:hypothetical protein
MQACDVALKLLLQGPATLMMRELTGGSVEKWLDIELPKVRNLRMAWRDKRWQSDLGSALVYSTLIGGSGTENARAIAKNTPFSERRHAQLRLVGDLQRGARADRGPFVAVVPCGRWRLYTNRAEDYA